MTKLDMTPGAQIPRTDAGPQTAVTQALSSVAYRDSDLTAFEDVQPGKIKGGRFKLLRPNLGEAFSKAVVSRTLGAKRNPLVPSFGVDARMVVQHCLAAQELRDARDRKLMIVTLVSGLLFLPGTLLWLAAFQIRAWLKKDASGRQDIYGTLVLAGVGLIAVLLAVRPPVTGLWALYFRVMTLAPVAGWFIAKRIVLRSTEDLRARWLGLVEGNGPAATVPKAVPRDDMDKKAATLKAQLGRLEAEQETNVHHYAGPKGLLGAGRRWGSWDVSAELKPAEGHPDFRTFHTWDLARKIGERLGGLGRSEVANGGMPAYSVNHWVIQHIPEGADEIGRPGGASMDGDGFVMRDHAVQEIANKQTFGQSGPRHAVATQFVLHQGQLISTVLVEIVVLSNILQITVSGYALGPVHGIFTGKPKPKELTRQKTGKFWEEETVQLPLIDNDEVIRQALRAPFMRAPVLLGWLGGGMGLPEPFGLRSAWVTKTWASRDKSDDVLRSATPVVSAVTAALVDFLDEHDIDTSRFSNRVGILKSELQSVRPFLFDEYPAG
ncbi:hypothetical protein GCM10018781_42720 [Kitasatospora indigofera]|uniref:Uncharacterized protein n=1 Tax=Kitasatospora indigofera TaxID=67307 RepID=A0A919KWW4_9ACTN|nr:hypothetical protein [Kitasatospora indigofera]GHH74921.1 hypothetical protein GCM10018781_42720 [Kitasatospora indigofera]